MTIIADAARGEDIIAAARRWIGTPYRHQASRVRVGADCLGLIRGVYEEVTGHVAQDPGAYAADWAEHACEERLLEAAEAHCGPPRSFADALPGDILVFRWRAEAAAKHAGILSSPRRFIHAYEQAGVIESPLTPGWARRVVGVFRFPQRPE